MARKRARNGDGSVFFNETRGRWEAQISLPNGKRKTLTAKTEREVLARKRAYERELAAGVVADTRITVKELIARWLDEAVPQRELAPSTVASYRHMADTHIVPHLGHIKLHEFRPADVSSWLTKLRKALSPRSVQYAHGLLKQALKEAMAWELVARNVAALCRPVRVKAYPAAPLDDDQLLALLSAGDTTRWGGLVRLGLGTGMRRGELLALRWADVDLKAGQLKVRKGKTDAAKRTIPLAPGLVDTLKAQRAGQNGERAAAGAAWRDCGLVFASSVGTPILGRNVTRAFKGLLRDAGLPATIRFHDLRHTAATLLAADGTHPRVAQAILGHASPTTTLKVYTHARPQELRVAADGLGGHLPARTAVQTAVSGNGNAADEEPSTAS